MRDSEDRFLSKIKSVVMVGGAGGVARERLEESMNDKSTRRRSSFQNMLTLSRIATEDPISPDNSDVNQMDMTAAQFFYKQCALLGIQLILIPNEVGSYLALLANSGSELFVCIIGRTCHPDFKRVLRSAY